MRRFSLLLLALLTSTAASAQDDRLQEIRDRYSAVTEDPEAEGLFQLHVTDNPDGRSYPAIGTYRQEYVLIYRLHENQSPVPMLVTVTSDVAAFQTRTEVLLDDDGVAMFLYYDYGEGSMRVYYDAEGRCFRYLVDGEASTCDARGEFEEGEADMVHYAQEVARLLETLHLGG